MAKKKTTRKPARTGAKKPAPAASKKPSQRPGKKPGKKVAKKLGKAPAKKPARRAGAPLLAGGVFKVETGSGPGPLEIGRDIVAMFNQGQLSEIEDKYWAAQVESVEGFGVNMGWRGRSAVDAKNKQWVSTHKIHGARAEGPFVGSSGFSIRFQIDVEDTTNGSREVMDEVGVYQVRDGKIVREEFMYAMP